MKTNEDIYTKGFGRISKTFMQDQRIPIAAKGLYAYLCSYSGKSGSAYPSRDKICYDLNINKDTFLKNMKYLLAYGYIEYNQRIEYGKFESNNYKIVNKPIETKSFIDKLEKKNQKGKNSQKENAPCLKISDTVFSDTKTSDTVKPDAKISDTKSNSFKKNILKKNITTTTITDKEVFEKISTENNVAVDDIYIKNVFESFCKLSGKYPNSSDIKVLRELFVKPLEKPIDLQTRKNIIIQTMSRVGNSYKAKNPGRKIHSIKYFVDPVLDEFNKYHNTLGGVKNEQSQDNVIVTKSGRRYDLSKFASNR